MACSGLFERFRVLERIALLKLQQESGKFVSEFDISPMNWGGRNNQKRMCKKCGVVPVSHLNRSGLCRGCRLELFNQKVKVPT